MSDSLCPSEYFNRVIGLIEDIVISDEFQTLQRGFMDKYCMRFDYGDENKIEYTEIFAMYTRIMEDHIVGQLNDTMCGTFDMDVLMNELSLMKGVLEGEIFELLFSLSDFLMFKEMILDHRTFKEGKCVDMSGGIVVTRMRSDEGLETASIVE